MGHLGRHAEEVARLAGRMRAICEIEVGHRKLAARMRYTNIVTFTTGALYSLWRALAAGYDPKPNGKQRSAAAMERFCIEEVRQRKELLSAIEQHCLPADYIWGGYYFNTSLYRTTAAVELIGEYFDGARKLIAREPTLSPVVRERDRMAHERTGIFRRNVFYEEMLAAVARLIELLEIVAQRLPTA